MMGLNGLLPSYDSWDEGEIYSKEKPYEKALYWTLFLL